MKKLLLYSLAFVFFVFVVLKFTKRNGQSFSQYSDSLSIINEKIENERTTNEGNAKSFNIETLASKTQAQIELIFGKPIKVEKFKDKDINCNTCPHNTYSNGVEIVFINGKADWFTLNNLKGQRFENCSIDFVGPFDCINRTFKSDNVIRWNNIVGINEVSLFQEFTNGSPTGEINYGYVKVITP